MGILDDILVDHLFFDDPLNGGLFLEMLRIGIEPRIIPEVENQRDVDLNPLDFFS